MAHIIVERFSSRCSECGGNADPYERSHVHGGPDPSGLGSDLDSQNGCGAEFTHHVSAYVDTSTATLREQFWRESERS